MKKSLLFLICIFTLFVFSIKPVYSVNEPYHTVANGNWSDLGIWEFYNGTAWIPAAIPPSSLSGTININHNITLNYDLEVDQLTVNDTLIIGTNIILTIIDGTGTDFINQITNSALLGPGIVRTSGNEVTLRSINMKSDFFVYQGKAKFIGYNTYLNCNITTNIGTILTIESGYSLTFYESVTNNGTIDGYDQVNFYGALVTNNGIIMNSRIGNHCVNFINNGTVLNSTFNIGNNGFNQYVSGSGVFSKGIFNAAGGTIFMSDINCADGCNVSCQTGLCDLNSYTLKINKGQIYYKFDVVPGSGTVETRDTVSLIGYWGGVTYDFPLRVISGFTYIGSVTMSRPIIIDSGATVSFYNTIVNNNLTNNGAISSAQSLSFYGNTLNNSGYISLSLYFYGSTLINNGTIESLNPKNGTHIIQGTGIINYFFIDGVSLTTLMSSHKMGRILIYSGGTFDISNQTLSVHHVSPIYIDNGTIITTNSTIEYNGIESQNISIYPNYYNLRINNPAGVKSFNNITIIDTLSLVSGDLTTFTYGITLPSTGYLVETPGNTVTGSGYITTTRALNAPLNLNVGGLGAIITSSSDLGSTEIRRYNATQNNVNGSTSILRYYDITPTNNSGLNASLIYKYDESELNGKPESSLQLFRSTNSGNTWTFRGGNINTSSNEITLSGIDGFSRWTAGSGYLTSSIKVFPEGLYNSTTNRLNRKDTVIAYLRNVSSPYSIVDSAQSAIDSVTFNGNFIFRNAPTGSYYIQIKHRNSVETWSKSGGESYNLGIAFSYDFTTSSSQAFGNNMKQADSSPLRFAVYSGDVSRDGSIDVTDVIQIYNDANNFVTGYVVTDLNRDNNTDITDVLLAYNNSVNFVGVIRP